MRASEFKSLTRMQDSAGINLKLGCSYFVVEELILETDSGGYTTGGDSSLTRSRVAADVRCPCPSPLAPESSGNQHHTRRSSGLNPEYGETRLITTSNVSSSIFTSLIVATRRCGHEKEG